MAVLREKEGLVVRSPLFSKLDVYVQAVTALILAPIVILGVLFLSKGGPESDFWLKITLATLTVIVLDILLESIIVVRRVTITPRGVMFGYLFHSEFGTWENLAPISYPPKFGRVSIGRRSPGGSPRIHEITFRQCRAILEFPGRPEWEFSKEVLALVHP